MNNENDRAALVAAIMAALSPSTASDSAAANKQTTQSALASFAMETPTGKWTPEMRAAVHAEILATLQRGW